MTMRWFFGEGKPSALVYAAKVLDALKTDDAIVHIRARIVRYIAACAPDIACRYCRQNNRIVATTKPSKVSCDHTLLFFRKTFAGTSVEVDIPLAFSIADTTR